MNWGKWIVVSFVLFAIFIGTLVVVCVRQDINLVASDYYKQELVFQKQIDRENNTLVLKIKPDINVVNSSIQISFRDFKDIQSGELKLFRPSNEKLDQVFELNPTSDTIQNFILKVSEPGLYKAQLKWSMSGKEYYLKKNIYL